MNRYYLVLDSMCRLVFKKKLTKDESYEDLNQEFQRLDFVIHVIEGDSLSSAITQNGLTLKDESAFYMKRELKDELFFTDKRIKEFLGEPDRVEKVKGASDKFKHLYAKSRVEKVLQNPEYLAHSEKVREGREKRDAANPPPVPSPSPFIVRSRRTTEESESIAREKIRHLVKKLRKDWDLNEYQEFFPLAREMKRKHVFFVGPTNSGKSYRGFNELTLGTSGVYLAPLRLLALEGQEEVEKRGKDCSLLTGEEMDIREGAQFVASTIEMSNLEKPIDCALIDEIQLILDKNRGWAWSQALIGVPAKQIIMTGSEECLPTLTRLIEDYLGETLEVVRLDRIGKLEIQKQPTRNLSQVESGTAIIAFSRRGVLSLKKDLEDAGRRVSVLYGNLSPGVRREEAKRFRSGETDILVATDCIGMGLNLPIKTVIFSETEKFDGKEVRPLNIQEVKQIGGRAGRFGKFECGYVGVTSNASLSRVNHSLHAKQEASLESCYVRPTLTQLEVLRDQIGGNNIKSSISLFSQLSRANSTIVCSDLGEMLGLAERIESIAPLSQLTFGDKYLFTCAPVSSTDVVIEGFTEWLVSYSKKKPILVKEEYYSNYTRAGSTSEDRILNDAENSVKILTLYHWLSRKKPEFFPSRELCEQLRDQINTFIESSLKRRGLHKKCPKCSKKIPLHHLHKVCDDCFRGKRW